MFASEAETLKVASSSGSSSLNQTSTAMLNDNEMSQVMVGYAVKWYEADQYPDIIVPRGIENQVAIGTSCFNLRCA